MNTRERGRGFGSARPILGFVDAKNESASKFVSEGNDFSRERISGIVREARSTMPRILSFSIVNWQVHLEFECCALGDLIRADLLDIRSGEIAQVFCHQIHCAVLLRLAV